MSHAAGQLFQPFYRKLSLAMVGKAAQSFNYFSTNIKTTHENWCANRPATGVSEWEANYSQQQQQRIANTAEKSASIIIQSI